MGSKAEPLIGSTPDPGEPHPRPALAPPSAAATVPDGSTCSGLLPADPAALVASLWERYSEEVYLYACGKLGNRDDARDLCQDTFIRVLHWLQQNAGAGETPNFPAWIMRIAANLVIDRYRSPARRRRPESIDAAAAAAPAGTRAFEDARTPSPTAGVGREAEVAALRDCLDQLPDVKRDVISSRLLGGVEYEAIASRHGLTVNHVRVMLHRAQKDLRDCVESKVADAGDADA